MRDILLQVPRNLLCLLVIMTFISEFKLPGRLKTVALPLACLAPHDDDELTTDFVYSKWSSRIMGKSISIITV